MFQCFCCLIVDHDVLYFNIFVSMVLIQVAVLLIVTAKLTRFIAYLQGELHAPIEVFLEDPSAVDPVRRLLICSLEIRRSCGVRQTHGHYLTCYISGPNPLHLPATLQIIVSHCASIQRGGQAGAYFGRSHHVGEG